MDISDPVVRNVGADTFVKLSDPVVRKAVVLTAVVAYVISTHRSSPAFPRLMFSNVNLSILESFPRFSFSVCEGCDGVIGSGGSFSPNVDGKL